MLTLEHNPISEIRTEPNSFHTELEPTHTVISKTEPHNPGPDRSRAPFEAAPEGKKWVRSALTIAFCFGILTAIVIPCFAGANTKAKAAEVKSNMRSVQIAAEGYATDNNGIYPTSFAQLSPYLPGGSLKIGGASGSLTNPVSFYTPSLVDGSGLVSVDVISIWREKIITRSDLKPGQVAYSAVDNGKSYAITGADPHGMQLSGIACHQLVLSNQ